MTTFKNNILISLFLLLICFSTLAQQTDSANRNSDTVRVLGADKTDSATLAQASFIVMSTTGATNFPNSKILDEECPPVQNQQQIGACVSYATAYDLCSILARRENSNWEYNSSHLFSPLAMHPFIRTCTNSCPRCGAQIGAALKFLHNNGINTLADYDPDPRDPKTCDSFPNLPDQGRYRIKDYGYLFSYNLPIVNTYKTYSIQTEISLGYPVAIAIALDNAFTHGRAFQNSAGVWQKFQEGYAGGHAMLIVGYDNDKGAFEVMNSWGADWITNKKTSPPGFCWISYEIINAYCLEAWVANTGQATVLGGQIFTSSRSVEDITKTEKPQGNKYNLAGGYYENGTYIHYFITNHYVQYNNVRFIPVHIDKEQNSSTIAIYLVENNTPKLNSTFNIKMGESQTFVITGHKYSFKALYIKRHNHIGAFEINYMIVVSDN